MLRILRTFITIALCLLALAACTSTTTYYALTDGDSWQRWYSSCSGPTGVYTSKLAEGVTLNVGVSTRQDGTYLWLSFLLARGTSVRLSKNVIAAHISDNNANVNIVLENFVSERDLSRFNLNDALHLKQHHVGRLVVRADEQILGLGRFENAPKGESSDDSYRTSSKIYGQPVESSTLVLPQMLVNGKSIQLEPLNFKRVTSTYLKCVQ
jgi:hypothetical protein